MLVAQVNCLCKVEFPYFIHVLHALIVLCFRIPEGSTSLAASRTCEHTEPHEQGTSYQEQDSHLNDGLVLITGQEQEEKTTEHHAETNAHESTKSVFEGSLSQEIVASLAGRTLQVLPTEALLTGWASGARQRTACHLAAPIGHDLAPFLGANCYAFSASFDQFRPSQRSCTTKTSRVRGP